MGGGKGEEDIYMFVPFSGKITAEAGGWWNRNARTAGIIINDPKSRGFMKMNPVVHFEMPAEDRKRMAEFYSRAFGWKTEQMGPEMGDYVVVTTTESGEDGRPKMPGAINGGFYQKTDDMPSAAPSVVIAVDDIKAHVKKVADAGGKIMGEPMEIPGVGWYVSFTDTEGNRVSMLQPVMK
jgi:predicted enzyme related to lactoylglutathione lyase